MPLFEPAAPSPSTAPPGRLHTTARSGRTARRVFLGALLATGVMTATWLFFAVTQRDGGQLFSGYALDRAALVRIGLGLVFFAILYGWLWYRIRRVLLRHVAGFSDEELEETFASRMHRPFDLAGLLARHSERRIRIIDMIGRRGRGLMLAAPYYVYVYARISAGTEPRFLTAGLVDGLLDATLLSWLYLAAYHSDGLLGRVVFGAPARLMDGALGRANCLLIVTLWNAFKLVMVPIGIQLTAYYPVRSYAALFGFVWVSYQAADILSEVVGSTIGRQRLRVWGIGEVNNKSVAGTVAAFVGSFGVCLAMIWLHGLPWPWLLLATAVSISNTLCELLSPRGTDDFTMATANALVCWGFGVCFY